MSQSTENGVVREGRWAVCDSYDQLGDGMFRKVREPMGITAFGMNIKVMQPGSSSRKHLHNVQQEVIFVHQGRIALTFADDTTREVGEGGIVVIDAGEAHQVTVVSDDPAVLVMLGGHDGVVEGDAEFF